MEEKQISQLTGCSKPCFYKKYTFAGDRVYEDNEIEDFNFSLWTVSNDTVFETEHLIYPWTSLLAEFGGTLGLFLGFSFMTIWDGIPFQALARFIKFLIDILNHWGAHWPLSDRY